MKDVPKLEKKYKILKRHKGHELNIPVELFKKSVTKRTQ